MPHPYFWEFSAPRGVFVCPEYESELRLIAGTSGITTPGGHAVDTSIRVTGKLGDLGAPGCPITLILAKRLIGAPALWDCYELRAYLAYLPTAYGATFRVGWVECAGGGRIKPPAALYPTTVPGQWTDPAPDSSPSPLECSLGAIPPPTWSGREARVEWVRHNFTPGELAYLYKLAHDADGLRRDKCDLTIRGEQAALKK